MIKRIFIAIEISAEARNEANSYLENLKKDFGDLRVGWERAEKLHLTLKFIGDVEESQLSKVIESVEKTAVKFEKFNISLEGTGVFPKPKNARILWIGFKDKGNYLLKIFEILEAELNKIGFAKESKRFHPHLTIARLKEPEKARKLVEKHLNESFEEIEFEVSEITIYESQLLPTGSKYQKIKSIPLAPRV
jgi:2'-5' RNA ligase